MTSLSAGWIQAARARSAARCPVAAAWISGWMRSAAWSPMMRAPSKAPVAASAYSLQKPAVSCQRPAVRHVGVLLDCLT